jgi:hypothetical protein
LAHQVERVASSEDERKIIDTLLKEKVLLVAEIENLKQKVEN